MKKKNPNVQRRRKEFIIPEDYNESTILRNLDGTTKSLLYIGDVVIWYNHSIKKAVLGTIYETTRNFARATDIPYKLCTGVKKGGFVEFYKNPRGKNNNELNVARIYHESISWDFPIRSLNVVINSLNEVTNQQLTAIYEILGITREDILFHRLPGDEYKQAVLYLQGYERNNDPEFFDMINDKIIERYNRKNKDIRDHIEDYLNSQSNEI
jgi:hypothetical protein